MNVDVGEPISTKWQTLPTSFPLSEGDCRPLARGAAAVDGQTLFEICARLIANHGLDSSRQAISQHLDVLETAGLVETRREGRWLTVVSPQDPDGTELLLEPSGHPAVKPFKEALVADGIPYTSFAVDDVKVEYERLRGLGGRFTQQPTDMGPVTTAVLDDTCGNLIQIAHQAS